jgi:hypothetical protein
LLFKLAALAFLLSSGAAQSAVLTLGHSFEGDDIRVDIVSGEISGGDELNESIDGVSEELKKDLTQNPEAPVEVAWVNTPEGEPTKNQTGKPAEKPGAKSPSRGFRFVQKVKERLLRSGLKPDREAGIDFDPEKDLPSSTRSKLSQAYLDHSKITWTVVRVVTNTGVRVATLMFAGLNFPEALNVGLGVFVGCSAVAWNSKHLLHFEENFRLYHVFSKQRFPKLRALLDSPAVQSRIAKPHYYLNWGLLEVLFGAIILFGENTARTLWGLDLDLPGLWPFLLSASVSTASQGVADLAVAKYEHLAKSAGMDPRLLDANLYKRLAFNSVVSVAGFTMINTASVPVKFTGYVLLGALSTYGFVYSKILDKKAIQGADPCNRLMIPPAEGE